MSETRLVFFFGVLYSLLPLNVYNELAEAMCSREGKGYICNLQLKIRKTK